MIAARWIGGSLLALALLACGAPAFGESWDDPDGDGREYHDAADAGGLSPAVFFAYVTGIQQQLAAHGYDPGPATGEADDRTAAAILAYQRDAGLPEDGEATQVLLNHLMFARPAVVRGQVAALPPSTGGITTEALPPDDRNLPPLPRETLVSLVQAQLADRGYYTGEIDGNAGPRTIEAVQLFQADARLPVTGAIDEALLRHLETQDPGIRVN